MAKFKIGDRVYRSEKGNGTIVGFGYGDHPLVEYDDWNGGHDGNGIEGNKCKPHHGWYEMPGGITYASDSKILITSDGKTTLARLYEGDKVAKSAEAKCSPSDTYDFATGAGLAFDRLMGRVSITNPATEMNKPAQPAPKDKPTHKYKVGDKATIRSDMRLGNLYGHIHYLEEMDDYAGKTGEITGIGPSGGYLIFGYYWSPAMLEPYTAPAPEPTKEPVKLYWCKKDYDAGESLKKGTVYDMSDGELHYEHKRYTGMAKCFLNDPSLFHQSWLKDYLVPLVQRPARCGEYVLPPDEWFTDNGRRSSPLWKVTEIDGNEDLIVVSPSGIRDCILSNRDYLVLDGYDGRYEQEKPKEPEPKEMTVAEIAQKLGYPVKVVEG